ncbi:MAG: SEC-C domain-containing protein [Candidatus Eisenbacteria bacterium]|nr:SEC-C domain-containing protein [Candidatus Eisenbacteria bacterium]
MSQVGRNALCPCGSGRKYKNCCLRKHEQGEREQGARSRRRFSGASGLALEWLGSHHGEAVAAAIEDGFFAGCEDDERERLKVLPDELVEALEINIAEWVLAEGRLALGVGLDSPMPTAMSLVLGPQGPALTPGQRAELEDLASRPLRLYEVVESRPGEGLSLRDLLAPEAPVLDVRERSASRTLVQWDVLGARVIGEGDAQVLSGALYPVAEDRVTSLLDVLRQALGPGSGRPESAREAANARDLVASIIIDEWLHRLVRPVQVPELRDAGTQERLMLITDHYEVLDWSRLSAALAAQPDVEGNRKKGWVRLAPGEPETGLQRSLLAINPGKRKDRLEPFARTQRLADEGRVWLESVAGDALRFLVRDTVDPMTLLKQKAGQVSPRSSGEGLRERPAAGLRPSTGSAPAGTEVLQQIHEHIYRNWSDEPIPALGDRTPREALRTDEGREQVVRLLKQYEAGESRRAREEQRRPVDFAFLWRQVGLERDEALRP